MFPTVSAMCDKCSSAERTLAHLFWFCPSLFAFWTAIFKWFSKCYSEDVKPDHNIAVFGCSMGLGYTTDLWLALQLGMIVAKKLILLAWKSTTPPKFEHWLNEMVSVIQMERLRPKNKDKQHRHNAVWGPFLAQCQIT